MMVGGGMYVCLREGGLAGVVGKVGGTGGLG